MLKSWETERLIVRRLVREDLKAPFSLIYGDPKVVRCFASYTTYAEVALLHKRKVEFNEDPASGGFGYFGVVLKDAQSLIGQVLLSPPEPAT
jgi:RimJ/RimL family protein N-acetyltransferase